MQPDSLMIRSANVLGTTIRGKGGHKLGTVRELFFERDTGQVRFVVLELAGMFTPSGKYHPIPWRSLRYDEKSEVYLSDLSKDQLKDSPAYDRDQLNDIHYGWSEQTERYFRVDPV